MKSIAQFYRYFNYLSLDVACGAMVCASFFSRILQVQLRPYGLASLGLTVWIIYTVDHLMDARKLTRDASSQRHRFHQQNFRVLVIVLAVAALIDLLVIFFVRRPILNWGIALSMAVLLYLFFQRRLIIFKELVVSLLYSAGILLPSMSLTTMNVSSSEYLLIGSFALSAFINLVLFSWYDWKHDLTDDHLSLVTYFGRNRVRQILVILFLLQAALLISALIISVYQKETFILGLINFPLLMLFLFPGKFSDEHLYRFIGDFVFLFPLIYLI